MGTTTYALLAEAAGALDETTLNAVKDGASSMTATVNQVVPIIVVAAVGIIALTAGVNFALKKLKGVMSKAS